MNIREYNEFNKVRETIDNLLNKLLKVPGTQVDTPQQQQPPPYEQVEDVNALDFADDLPMADMEHAIDCQQPM
jgi:hypothetical protein